MVLPDLDITAQIKSITQNYLELLDGKATLSTLSGTTQEELEALYERGYSAWNHGIIEESTIIFAFLALQQPFDRRFSFAFACALQQQGEYHHALTLFSISLAMQPNDPFASYHIAECLLALDEQDAACDALDAVIALSKDQLDENPHYVPLYHQAQTLLDKFSHS